MRQVSSSPPSTPSVRRGTGESASEAGPRPPSPPSQTFHPSLLSSPIPSEGLFGSAAAGAHYSGAKVAHRRSDMQRASFGTGSSGVELDDRRRQVVNDLKEVRAGR